MVRLNRTRMDFLQEFQKMIDEYNSGALNMETFFAKLTAFARKLHRRREAEHCRATNRGRIDDFRPVDEAGDQADKGGGDRGQDGGETTADDSETGKAGSRLEEASEH